MRKNIALLADSKTSGTLLFSKVAGFPLLLRNILTLNKMGYAPALFLPSSFKKEFKKKISKELDKRKIKIDCRWDMPLSSTVSSTGFTLPCDAFIDPRRVIPHSLYRIDSPQKIAKAEKDLCETIRQSTPGPVAKYLNKRISLPISLWLAKTNIHPNWVTLANMVLGIASGFWIAKGTYLSYLIGALMFQLASILDGCDGELAKLKFKTSRFGQYLDTLSDNGALISFFIGLIAAFSKNHAPAMTLGMALLLVVGLGGLLGQMILYLKKYTKSASLATFDKEYLAKLPATSFFIRCVQVGKIFVRKDVFSLGFFILALFGWLPVALYLAVFGTWIANGSLLYLKLAPSVAHEEIR